MKKHILLIGTILVFLVFNGCGDGKQTPPEPAGSLIIRGTYVSVEQIENTCFIYDAKPLMVAKLTVDFSEDSVCVRKGCSDLIECAEVNSNLSIADRLKIVGKNCVFTAEKISCAGITFQKK